MIMTILFLMSFNLMANDLYVKSSMLKLYEKPSRKANVVEILPNGEKLKYLDERKGAFLKVKYSETTGWAFKYQISRKPIKQRPESLFVEVKNVKEKARESGSSYSSTASARGFTNFANSGKVTTQIIIFNKEEEIYRNAYKDLEFLISRQVNYLEAAELLK